ncbi:hypothetical protein KCU93_g3469, partial [Aureobasidium melanogenum]
MMSFRRGSSTLLGSMIRYQPPSKPVSVPSPLLQTPGQAIGQRIVHNRDKPKSILETLKASQAGERKSSGTGLTFGAALLMGGTFLMAPLKEGSPARVILNSSEHLLNSRKQKKQSGILTKLAWIRDSYGWIIAQVWTLIITIMIWWRLGRLPKA